MLVLSRRCATEIYIGPDIIIKVLEIHKRQVKLGIEAPSGFSVWRGNSRESPIAANPVSSETCRSQQRCFAKPHRRHSYWSYAGAIHAATSRHTTFVNGFSGREKEP